MLTEHRRLYQIEYRKLDKNKEKQKEYQKSEKGRESQRKYRQSKKCEESQKKYSESEKGKKRRKEYQENQYHNDLVGRKKIDARIKVSIEIKLKKLVKLPCIICNSVEKVQAHHEDYSKPLDITWLCHEHHMKRHVELRKINKK